MDPINRQSVVTATADRLRQAILTGALAPGDPIVTRALQESLGVSHIPIREALRQLEAEGLVEAPPRRTPTVASVGLEELEAIYDLRRMIELPTVRRARENATPAAVDEVRKSYEEFARVARGPSVPEYWSSHREFHWALLAPGANSWVRRTLEPLWHASERYVRIFVTAYAGVEGTLRMHEELLDAFEDPDPDTVAAALLDHFVQTEGTVREGFLAAWPPDGDGDGAAP